MKRVFLILSSADKEVHNELSFKYALNAHKYNWMDEILVILWGPTERLAAEDEDFREQVKMLLDAGIKVIACKACSDGWGISDKIVEHGVTVQYVGKLVSDLLKEGWHQLTF